VCKFLAAALEVVAVLCLNGILDSTGYGVVGTENGALHKLDFTGHATLEATSSSDGAARLLTLSPGLGRARLAPLIWGGGALGGAKVSGWVIAARGRVDVGALVCLARVLCRPVGRVRLGQAVCGVGADFRIAVEGVLLLACGVLVEQRAADLVLVVAAVVLLDRSVRQSQAGSCASRQASGASQGRDVRRHGAPHSFAGCTP
jgi:hypothetical protein